MTRAAFTKEVNPHTGKVRLRCAEPKCGKVAYATQERAEFAVRTIRENGGDAMYVYLGPRCGWYHLSRVNR